MEKRLLKLIMAIFIGGILILPHYCPYHHKVDDCWITNSPYGDNKGPK